MFKKSVESKSQQRLSGADRKKLKRTIKERFPNASDSDLDILIPPKVVFIFIFLFQFLNLFISILLLIQ